MGGGYRDNDQTGQIVLADKQVKGGKTEWPYPPQVILTPDVVGAFLLITLLHSALFQLLHFSMPGALIAEGFCLGINWRDS